jgi:hypothetical protein
MRERAREKNKREIVLLKVRREQGDILPISFDNSPTTQSHLCFSL